MLGKVSFLNNNSIKIIACLTMLIDHIGLMLFPGVATFRIIGRIAMPLFAFCIAQGCKYTKNKLKYFLMVFLLGVLCQTVYFIVEPKNIYFGILITFSVSILLIYSFNFVKKCFLEKNVSFIYKILSLLIFIALLFGAYLFCRTFRVDYGILGCLIPVICSISDFKNINCSEWLKKLDNNFTQFVCFVLAMAFYTAITTATFSDYSLFAIIFILFYNGKRGKLNLKYAFYIFYPLHLVVLEAIAFLI